MKLSLAVFVIGMLAVTLSPLRAGARAIKVGVLPYSDATASAGSTTGDTLSRLTQAEIVHSTQMEGRVVVLPADLKPEQLDSKKIVELGKANNVDLIVMGTLLEAHSEESTQNGMGHAIFGQMVGGGLHSAKATVTIQADIYEVASGKKLDSLRISQSQSDRKISGTVFTTLGSADTSSTAFQNSTLGKALQKTITELVKRLDSEKSKVTSPATPA